MTVKEEEALSHELLALLARPGIRFSLLYFGHPIRTMYYSWHFLKYKGCIVLKTQKNALYTFTYKICKKKTGQIGSIKYEASLELKKNVWNKKKSFFYNHTLNIIHDVKPLTKIKMYFRRRFNDVLLMQKPIPGSE